MLFAGREPASLARAAVSARKVWAQKYITHDQSE